MALSMIIRGMRSATRMTIYESFPGLAHLSPDPFGADGPWWGSPWRRRRAFVGKLSYGGALRAVAAGARGAHALRPDVCRGVVAAFYALTMGWAVWHGKSPSPRVGLISRSGTCSSPRPLHPPPRALRLVRAAGIAGDSRDAAAAADVAVDGHRLLASQQQRERTTTRASTTSATRTTSDSCSMTTFTWPRRTSRCGGAKLAANYRGNPESRPRRPRIRRGAALTFMNATSPAASDGSTTTAVLWCRHRANSPVVSGNRTASRNAEMAA